MLDKRFSKMQKRIESNLNLFVLNPKVEFNFHAEITFSSRINLRSLQLKEDSITLPSSRVLRSRRSEKKLQL